MGLDLAEDRAVRRFRQAQARGVRHWYTESGAVFEVLGVRESSVFPSVTLRTDRQAEMEFTMRSFALWTPMELV